MNKSSNEFGLSANKIAPLLFFILCSVFSLYSHAGESAGLEIPTLSLIEPEQEYNPGWSELDADPVSPAEARQTLGEPALSVGVSPSASFGIASAFANPSDYNALAEALDDDPRRIYQFIRNNFDYVPYYGALKGPYLTLHERAGNDFDQAALLVELLRAAGYTANYQYGTVTATLSDSSVLQSISEWLGTDEDYGLILNSLAAGGVPVSLSGDTLEFDHVWVEVVINGSLVSLDPSFKKLRRHEGIDVEAGMGLNLSSLLGAAGGTITDDSIQGIDEESLDTYLTSMTSQLETYLQQQYPNASFEDIVGGFSIVPDNSAELPNGLALNASPTFSAWSEIPSNYRHTVRMQHGGIDVTYDISDIAGRKFSIQYSGDGSVDPAPNDAADFGSVAKGEVGGIFTWTPSNSNSVAIQVNASLSGSGASAFTFVSGGGTQTIPAGSNVEVKVQLDGGGETSGRKNATLTFNYSHNGSYIGESNVSITGVVEPDRVAEFYIDDQLSVSEGTPSGNLNNFVVSVDHPYAASNGTYADQSATFELQRSGSYVLASAFGGDRNSTLLPERQRILNLMNIEEVALDSPEMVSETLNIIGQTWMQQTQLNDDMLSILSGQRTINHHRFGIAGQGDGYYVDVKAQQITTSERFTVAQEGAFQSSSFIASAMEHSVLEQLQGADNPGISTIKIFALNNQNGNKLFLSTSANFSSVREQLSGYSSSQLSQFQNLVNSGHTMILPENGSVALNDWSGAGYVDYNSSGSSRSMGMIIGGGLHGGFSSLPQQVNPVYTQTESFAETLPPANTPTPTAADPVDLGSGAFLSNHTDLALGGGGSNGLSFSRRYNSQQVSQNTSNIGNGWSHSYNINISEHSDVSAALGEKTVFEALPHIVANQVMLALMAAENPEIEEWAVGAMVANWATDELLNKSRTVYLGGQAFSYRELPNGTFARPAGTTADLVKLGDNTFELRERHGRVLKFNAQDRIESITDVDGNAIDFAYSGDYLMQVTDAFGRALIFSYSGDLLSSVTDSTGRSVSFGYLADNLTDVTGLESAQWEYSYDNLNRMLSITDPLDAIMVTNNYDDFDRVTRQYAPRANGTATYRFHYTGLSSSEETPDGARTTYYYDFDKRTISVENAMGSRTFTAYDGQGHGVSFVDTMEREVTMTYDGDHNLIASMDPLAQVSSFTYDAQHRMTAATDTLNHTSETDFDSEHHPIASRDALGNEAQSTYRFDGLVDTVTDPRQVVTSFTYDSNGFPAAAQTGSQPAVTTNYDAIGRLLNLTDQAGAVTSYSYDDRGLVLSRTDPLNQTANMSYNALGQLVTQQDRNGDTYTASYTATQKLDVLNFPARSATANHPAVPAFSVDFDYDTDRDRLVSMTDQVGVTTNQYDVLDRLISHRDPNNFEVQYSYDQANNLSQMTYPDGKTLSYSYDNLDRIAGISIDWLGKSATPTYDAGSRLTRLDNFNDTYTTFSYDDANRLTSLGHFKDSATKIAQYDFVLDANGNRVQTTIVNEPILPTGLINKVSNRTYNNTKNRLLTADTTESVSFLYDDEGQTQKVTGESINTQYIFDGAHRLIGSNSATGNASYVYDGTGNRLSATRNGVTTKYIYNATGQLIAEADNDDNITRYYIHGLGVMAFVEADTNKLYVYHHDATGHTVAVSDDNKDIVNRYAYGAYGQLLDQSVQVSQPFTYAGQAGIYTEANGIYYMRARYYDANIQRFISEDPSGIAGGLNQYAYAGGNPIMSIDPSGLGPEAGGIGSAFLEFGLGFFPGYDLYQAATNPNSTGFDISLGIAAVFPGGGKAVSILGKAVKWGMKSRGTAIGRVKDLQKLNRGETSLLDRLPNQGSPKANWKQNSGVLRQEMGKGKPIRDASPGDTSGQFLNAERNLLESRGWSFDNSTNYWNPPK
ncbi:MAG: hypothetical protein KUG82_06850 [Pseudomonadales bacterium]|nr:hypothetical protein [Pseudomonadales bacterium]